MRKVAEKAKQREENRWWKKQKGAKSDGEYAETSGWYDD
jgi:hypothetical protein